MEFKIGLAGKVIGITSMHEEIYEMCKEYLTDGTEDFHVMTSQADIEFERKKSIQEAVIEGILPQDYPDDYLETLAVYRRIAVEMLRYDTMLMHGAVVGIRGDVGSDKRPESEKLDALIAVEGDTKGAEGDGREDMMDAKGKAVLFTAQSGVGKTTHLRLWLDQIPGAFVVNGDKPLLRFQDGSWQACGTPWAGKEGIKFLYKCEKILKFCYFYLHCPIWRPVFVHNNNYHMNTLSYYRGKVPGKSLKRAKGRRPLAFPPGRLPLQIRFPVYAV